MKKKIGTANRVTISKRATRFIFADGFVRYCEPMCMPMTPNIEMPRMYSIAGKRIRFFISIIFITKMFFNSPAGLFFPPSHPQKAPWALKKFLMGAGGRKKIFPFKRNSFAKNENHMHRSRTRHGSRLNRSSRVHRRLHHRRHFGIALHGVKAAAVDVHVLHSDDTHAQFLSR